LKNADVTDEELYTWFVGVESLLNSRPLMTVSDNPNNALVLKPNILSSVKWVETYHQKM